MHGHRLLCINASASQPKSDTLQSALEKTSLLKSISRPASSHPTDTDQILHLPSALARTPLHLCISQPASLDPTNTEQDHHHLPSTLVLAPLLSISRPASFSPTGTDQDLQGTLVPTLLPPGISPPASLMSVNLTPTGQSLQWSPTPAHLHYTDRDRTVSPV